MSRTSDAQIELELAEVERIINAHAEGIARSEIATQLAARQGRALGMRTLLRRIERLVDEQRITVEGAGPSRRYRRTSGTARTEPSPERASTDNLPAVAPEASDDEPSWLSPAGAQVRALVRRPRGERPYVTYRRQWLEAYSPGTTWYLDQGTRAHLHRIGATPEGDRPAGTYARQILSRLLIDLSWASSRLEGNTYSRLDTQNLIEFGQRAAGKDATEAQMILNHKDAIEFLVHTDPPAGLDPLTIRSIHAILSAGLLRNAADEGRLRLAKVGITGTTYLPTEDPNLIRECFEILLTSARGIADPFECSLFLLVHLPYLQPFIDVNKRTSRLAANIPLLRANLCPLTFVDLPEQDYVYGILGVYERNRVELLRDLFVHAYERSCELYVAAKAAAVSPDPIRLRYREELRTIVADTVRALEPPDRESLRRWAAERGVRAEDSDAFAELALTIIVDLNEASAQRHRLTPREFDAWRVRFRK